MACAPVALAQPTQAPQPTNAPSAQLDSVVVKGQTLPRDSAPYSLTVIDAERVRDAAIHQPEKLLRQVPGVELRPYNLGGVVNVVTIRGFSGGAHGGDLGMVIDGIPLNEAMSHADGYADLNVIVPLEIERYGVYRGPVSALYGNFNRGGLIAIESRRGGRYAELDASIGAFETVDLQGAFGGALGAGRFNGAAQAFRSDDFRPHSSFTRGTLAARWTLPLSASTALSLSARGHQSDWDSASYLLKTQFDAGDSYGIDPRVKADGGAKEFGTLRLDLEQALGREWKLLAFAYGTQQDYTRWFTRPLSASAWSQREERYERGVGGIGFSVNAQQRLGGVALAWTAGAEAYRERTDYLFFEGLNARTRTGAAVYDRRYRFDSQSAFVEGTAKLAPWLEPTLGLRWDRFSGGCERRAESGSDPCSTLGSFSRATPKLGLRSTVVPGLDLRASWAEGFALPPGVAKYAPGGADLKATVFKQAELGVSYKGARWRGELVAYELTSSNEVRTVSPGVYENFGRTRRKGVEAALTLTPIDSLELALIGNRAGTSVLENSSAALIGKQIAGVPRASIRVSAAWRPASGLGASAEVRRVGDSAVDAANTFFYGRFTTLDLALQYMAPAGSGMKWRAYAKLENATDRVYAGNAFIIGGQQLVAPAAPRSLSAGVQIDF